MVPRSVIVLLLLSLFSNFSKPSWKLVEVEGEERGDVSDVGD